MTTPEPARGPVQAYAGMTPVRVMVNTLAVLFVIGMVWLVIQIRSIVLLLIVGILLAAAIEPLIFRLRRRGLSRGQSILTIYAAIIAILAVGLYLIVPQVITQSTELYNQIPDYLATFRTEAGTSGNRFVSTVGIRTIDRASKLYADLQSNPPIKANQAIGLVTSVFGFVLTIVSVLIVAFYWMTEKALIKRVVLGLFPIDRRDRAHGLWDEIEAKLGGWARGQLLLMLIIGVLSTIAYFALGLPFWFLLGIWAGLTELIPFIGPVLGGATAALVALTVSWEKALVVVGFFVVLQQLEGSVLVPRVMRNAVGLTPLSVVLAVLIGGTLMGPIGAVLAIPVAAAVQVMVQDLLRNRAEAVDTGITGANVAATLTGRPQPIPHTGGTAYGLEGSAGTSAELSGAASSRSERESPEAQPSS